MKCYSDNYEASTENADTSNYNVHQFIVKHEARNPMGSDDSKADAAKNINHY